MSTATAETPTWRRVKTLGLVAGGAVLLYALRDVAQLVLIATLLAYVLNPLVVRLEGRTSRNKATLIVCVALGASIAAITMLLAPVVETQVLRLEANVDAEQVQVMVEEIDRRVSSLLDAFGGAELGLAERLRQSLDSLSSSVVDMAPGVLGIVGNIVVVPFLAVFLLRDGPQVKNGIIRLVPNRYFEFALDAIHKVDQQLGRYLRGLLLDVLAVATMSAAAFWMLGIGSSVLLGVITGVFNVIPYIGALLGGGIAAIVTLLSTGSAAQMTAVIGAVFVVQIIDEVIVQPLLLSKAVALHPIEIVLAIMVASQFFGVFGMVLAVPVASAGKVVVTEGLSLIQQYRFD